MKANEKDEVLEELKRIYKLAQKDKRNFKEMTLFETFELRYWKRPNYRYMKKILLLLTSRMEDRIDKKKIEGAVVSNIEHWFKIWPRSNIRRLGRIVHKYPIRMKYFPKDGRE